MEGVWVSDSGVLWFWGMGSGRGIESTQIKWSRIKYKSKQIESNRIQSIKSKQTKSNQIKSKDNQVGNLICVHVELQCSHVFGVCTYGTFGCVHVELAQWLDSHTLCLQGMGSGGGIEATEIKWNQIKSKSNRIKSKPSNQIEANKVESNQIELKINKVENLNCVHVELQCGSVFCVCTYGMVGFVAFISS